MKGQIKNSLILCALLVLGQSCNSRVTYETSNNDQAEIRLTLNPDKTLDFYFKSFDEPDTLDSNPKRETIFESHGTWRTVGNDIEVTFKRTKEDFNYRVIFENKKNTSLTINDTTFRFDKNKEMIAFWGIDSYKN